jgi:O-antigen/teichoic acid export membrane protein
MTLSALDKPKSAAIAALIATALNIPLNLLLIPWFGIFGAAMAILITVIIHALCVAIRLKAYIPLTLDLRALRSICIATLTMACSVTVVVHLIPLNHFLLLAGVIFLGACIYFLILSRLEKGVDTALRKMMSEMGIIIPDWL